MDGVTVSVDGETCLGALGDGLAADEEDLDAWLFCCAAAWIVSKVNNFGKLNKYSKMSKCIANRANVCNKSSKCM